MAKLFNIPLRNIQRWEAETVKPPEWAKELILNELERLAKQVEERQRLDAHILGYLYGYFESLFIDNRNWEAIPEPIHKLTDTDPIGALLKLMHGAQFKDIHPNRDLVAFLLSNAHTEDYEDKDSDNIKFNNYPKGFFDCFQFARIQGQVRAAGGVMLCLNRKNRTIYDMLNDSGFTEEEVAKILTAKLNPATMTGEQLQQLADYLKCSVAYLKRETNNPAMHPVTEYGNEEEQKLNDREE